MLAVRLAPARHPPFDGEGARLFGGRWNSAGVPLVYLSEHLSLAVLESLVYQDRLHLPDDLVAHTVKIPDAPVEHPAEMPPAWFADPLRRQTRRFGSTWARELRSLALRVPSAVIPSEFNLLLNPRHADIEQIERVDEQPFVFDPRLRRG
ncbi:MAG: RES domain-containing protein [Gemmatimonadota bacterium]|jgi:RES domain-containing protein|nr:RES domain-containing protein [Gemmatimonadota bacterium]